MARKVVTERVEIAADADDGRTRWGGALLAVGYALAIVSLALYMTLPPSGVDGAARASQIAANAGTVRTAGYTGLFANAFIVVGALFLATRQLPNRWNIPSAFWLAVGVGSLVGIVVQALFGAGYVVLAQNYATGAATFQAVLVTLTALAGISYLTTGAGGAMVFLAEASSERRAVPAALGYVGVLGAVCALVVGVGFVTGVLGLVAAAYGVFLFDIAALALGVKLAMPPSGSGASAATRSARA